MEIYKRVRIPNTPRELGFLKSSGAIAADDTASKIGAAIKESIDSMSDEFLSSEPPKAVIQKCWDEKIKPIIESDSGDAARSQIVKKKVVEAFSTHISNYVQKRCMPK